MSRYSSPLIVESTVDHPDRLLAIEVWLHSKDKYIDIGDLPFIKDRLKSQEYVGFTHFHHEDLSDLTASVLITTVEVERDKNYTPRLLAFVWRKGSPLIFAMEPQE